MKIAHFGVKKWETEYFLSNLNSSFEQKFFEVDDLSEVIYQVTDVEVITIFIHTNIDASIMDKLPNLKLILTRSTGFDHIDTKHAADKNIKVGNVPGYGSNTVAEHTFALLLAISKQIFKQASRSRELNFSFEDNLGFDLNGKTIGVVGAGKIGRNAIQIAKGFDMNVIAFDVYKDYNIADKLGFKYVEIDELLAKSDILTLHTPLNEYTKDILSRENLAKLKPGTVFLNTSRGALISNEDLLFALENGIFGAAGLDTINGEESMFSGNITQIQQKILQHPNVLYTPHSAFYTKEAVTRIIQTTIDNILEFTKDTLKNQVN